MATYLTVDIPFKRSRVDIESDFNSTTVLLVAAMPNLEDKYHADLMELIMDLVLSGGDNFDGPQSPNFWNYYSFAVREELKVAVIKLLKQGHSETIDKNLWKLAGKIMNCFFLNEQNWEEMMVFFLDSLRSGNPYTRYSAIAFFMNFPEDVGEQHLRGNIDDLLQAFWNTFICSEGQEKISAMCALLKLIQHISSGFYGWFEDLVMPMVNAVSNFLKSNGNSQNDKDNAQMALTKIVLLVETDPDIFQNHLDELFNRMLEIAENEVLSHDIRLTSFEVMWTFSDLALQKIAPLTVSRLFEMLMNKILQVSEEGFDHVVAEQFMGRICSIMGQTLKFKHVVKTLDEYSLSTEWNKRYTAVVVINIIAKSCAQVMQECFDDVITIATQLITDSSPKVSLASIKAIEAISKVVPQHQLDQHAGFFINELCLTLADSNKPDNQVAAASALHALCKHCSFSIVEFHLEKVVDKLLQLLQSKQHEVRSESISTLISFGKLSQGILCKCYQLAITSLEKHLAG